MSTRIRSGNARRARQRVSRLVGGAAPASGADMGYLLENVGGSLRRARMRQRTGSAAHFFKHARNGRNLLDFIGETLPGHFPIRNQASRPGSLESLGVVKLMIVGGERK